MKVKSIRVRAVSAPMKKPLVTSIATVSSAALLLIDLQTDQGITGRSYLFAVGKHNLAPIAKLVEAMAEMIKGDEVSPFDLERKLRAKYALLGVHNIVLFAIAGIDVAAWDAWAQSLGALKKYFSPRPTSRNWTVLTSSYIRIQTASTYFPPALATPTGQSMPARKRLALPCPRSRKNWRRCSLRGNVILLI